MTKILLTNTNCSWNKGSAAHVVVTVQVLRKHIPNAEFALISQCPELDSKQCSSAVKIVGYYSKNSRKMLNFSIHLFQSLVRGSLYSLFQRINKRLKAGALLNEEYLREYDASDLIIDLSGDSYSDSRGGISALNSLGLLLGILLKKRIVLYSQSIGPFNKWTKPLAKFVLNRVDLIVAREEITEKYLQQIGVTRPPIHVAADGAFLLKPDKKNITDLLLKNQINADDRPIVGISANAMMKETNYTMLMANLVDYLVDKLGAQVIFVPHVVSMVGNPAGDDRHTGKEIQKLAKHKDRIKIIESEYSPQQLKSIIAMSDIFIGGRMHANIAALSSCVPTMAIAWSHKYYGIMEALGQQKYVCNLSTMTLNELKSKIDDLWNDRNSIKEELKSKVKNQERSALAGVELILNFLPGWNKEIVRY